MRLGHLECVSDADNMVAALREAFGLTQEELADAIRTDQGTISKIERGVLKLSWERAIAISDFLGVPLDTLRCKRFRRGRGR